MNTDAADWFARMRGPDAAAARAAFDHWYADPNNAAAYDDLARSWEQAKFLANTPTGRARNLDLARSDGTRRSAVLVGAALLGVLLLCFLWISPRLQSAGDPDPRALASEIASRADAVRIVALADGSRVTLDRASRLGIEFTETGRRLILRAGRARFDVAHDPARPFAVEAGGGSVVAHGTVFDVAIIPDGVEVVLLRGAVEVRDRSAQAVPGHVRHLEPGEKIAFSRGRLTTPVAATPRDTQWVEPLIEFRATPLGEAIAVFNQLGGRPIRIEGKTLQSLRVTGAFRRDDPEAFAATLAATFGLIVRNDDPAALTLAAPAAPVRDKKTIG